MVGAWISTIKTLMWSREPDTTATRSWRIALTLGCLGVLVLQVFQLVRSQPCYSNTVCNFDFQHFYDGSLDIQHRVNPYLTAILGHTRPVGSTYVYPPFFGVLVIPFTALPLPRALMLWDVLNVGFLAGSVAALLSAAGQRPRLLLVVLFTVLASSLSPLRAVLYWGQSDLLILFCISTAVLAGSARKSTAAGILLAVACAVKPTYLALVVFLLWKREFKCAIVTVLAFLVFFFAPFIWLGGQSLHDELSTLLFVSNTFAANIFNHAPKGVLQRLFTPNAFVRPLFVAPWLVTFGWLVVAAIVLLFTAAMISPRPLQRNRETLLEVGLALLALLLAGPVTEDLYLSLLMIPLVALYVWLPEGWSSRRGRVVIVGVLAVVLVMYAPIHTIDDAVWSRMANARWPLGDVYMLLGATYLYILIAQFALQLNALSLTTGQSIREAVRRIVVEAPGFVGQWLHDAHIAWASLGLAGGGPRRRKLWRESEVGTRP